MKTNLKFVNKLNIKDIQNLLLSMGLVLSDNCYDEKTGEKLLPIQISKDFIMCRCEYANIDTVNSKYKLPRNIYEKLSNLKIESMIEGIITRKGLSGKELVFLKDFKVLNINADFDEELKNFYNNTLQKCLTKKFKQEYIDALEEYNKQESQQFENSL